MGVEIINSNKKIKLNCIDTWNGSIENISPGEIGFEPNLLLDKDYIFKIFKESIKPLGNVVTFIRSDSLFASNLYADESLEFVFIDASHQYKDVKDDIQAWFPKVKKGGIIAGHDYSWCDDVKRAVDEFFIGKSIEEEDGCWIHYKRDPIVIDCFLFYNELDMLKLRIEENNDIVDYFILVESTKTFTNIPKKLYYQENKKLFEKYDHKIIHVIVDDMPDGDDGIYDKVGKGSNWNRERHQRNCMMRGIQQLNLHSDDIILIGDVDEIISHDCLQLLKSEGVKGIYVLYYDFYLYNLETKSPNPWNLTRICNYDSLIQVGNTYNVRDTWEYNRPILPNGYPKLPGQAWIIENAGWHFSYFGGKDSIVSKIKSFSHQELNNKEILGNIEKSISKKVSITGDVEYDNIPIENNLFLPKKFDIIKKTIREIKTCSHLHLGDNIYNIFLFRKVVDHYDRQIRIIHHAEKRYLKELSNFIKDYEDNIILCGLEDYVYTSILTPLNKATQFWTFSYDDLVKEQNRGIYPAKLLYTPELFHDNIYFDIKLMNVFIHYCEIMNVECPIKDVSDVLLDMKELLEPNILTDNYDLIIGNSTPMSQQWDYNDKSIYNYILDRIDTSKVKVLTLEPNQYKDIPCTMDYGLNLMQVGSLSVNAKRIIALHSSPYCVLINKYNYMKASEFTVLHKWGKYRYSYPTSQNFFSSEDFINNYKIPIEWCKI